jgi:hypothetical protein
LVVETKGLRLSLPTCVSNWKYVSTWWLDKCWQIDYGLGELGTSVLMRKVAKSQNKSAIGNGHRGNELGRLDIDTRSLVDSIVSLIGHFPI